MPCQQLGHDNSLVRDPDRLVVDLVQQLRNRHGLQLAQILVVVRVVRDAQLLDPSALLQSAPDHVVVAHDGKSLLLHDGAVHDLLQEAHLVGR